MFTGIIETTGRIKSIKKEGANIHFEVASSLAPELRVDQSLSHNGVCLTVIEASEETYRVTAVEETLKKSTLGSLKVNDEVNLERAMPTTGRFDGHFVQGHVDVMGTCQSLEEREGSWLFGFQHPYGEYPIVEKGSITINGVSLTCFEVKDGSFRVTIIPYTYEHTNFHAIAPGDSVNLEFDIIGKYVQKMIQNSGYLPHEIKRGVQPF